MSDVFDIEKFSENAERLTKTLEKSSTYINDVDQAMTRLSEAVNDAEINAKLDSYGQKLQELQQGSRQILDNLSGQPEELKEAARRLLETTEQFGNSYQYLESYKERAERLTELLESLGTLSEFEERLKKYEAELETVSGTLDKIKKQELEIRNIPNVLKAMKESVTDLQKQYIEAAADLRDQGNEALTGVRGVKDSVNKAEELQRTLSDQVGFFKIGIYALIVMNTLMTVFMIIFLMKEFFFS